MMASRTKPSIKITFEGSLLFVIFKTRVIATFKGSSFRNSSIRPNLLANSSRGQVPKVSRETYVEAPDSKTGASQAGER